MMQGAILCCVVPEYTKLNLSTFEIICGSFFLVAVPLLTVRQGPPVEIRAMGVGAIFSGGTVPRSSASDPSQVDGGECDGFAAPAHGEIGDVDACGVHAIGPSWRESLSEQVAHDVGCSSRRA